MMTVVLFGGFVALVLLAGALHHAFALTSPMALALLRSDPSIPDRAAERAELAAAGQLGAGAITGADYRSTLEALAAAEPQPSRVGRLTG